MPKAEVEVITSERRRRHWSRAEKERIVAAALEPGATILGVAREFGAHSSQGFCWRYELCGKVAAPASGFVRTGIAAAPETAAPSRGRQVIADNGVSVMWLTAGLFHQMIDVASWGLCSHPSSRSINCISAPAFA
ncbi:transposase [Bradyrhizobium sp. STM 3557]|uniref:transposase n=1 Tax=Bradyrhizobium sp. STM 3557 TaxID=578920 RepID=UPI00388F43F2